MYPKKLFAMLGAVLLLLSASLSLSACSCTTKEEQAIQDVIQEYYDRSYQSWLTLEMEDFTDLLCADSIQMENYETALEENIYRWEQTKKYDPEQVAARKRYTIYYDFESITLNETATTATVSVTLSGETKGEPAYPIFVVLGPNMFTLKKEGDLWKISSHEYEEATLFEQSLTERISFNKEAIEKEVAEEYAA